MYKVRIEDSQSTYLDGGAAVIECTGDDLELCLTMAIDSIERGVKSCILSEMVWSLLEEEEAQTGENRQLLDAFWKSARDLASFHRKCRVSVRDLRRTKG